MLSFLLSAVACRTILNELESNNEISAVYGIIQDLPFLKYYEESSSTIFVPNNKAIENFKNEYPAYYDTLTNNASALVELVKYHTLPNVWNRPEKADSSIISTLHGQIIGVDSPANQSLAVVIRGGLGVRAEILRKIKCDNGKVYIINNILPPPLPLTQTALLLGWSGFTNASIYGSVYGVLDKLKDKTFFIPSNQAIAKMTNQLTRFAGPSTVSIIIDNHISNGVLYYKDLFEGAKSKSKLKTALPNEWLSLGLEKGKVKVQGSGISPAARVESANIFIEGGVVHVVDNVILPSTSLLLSSLLFNAPTIPQ